MLSMYGARRHHHSAASAAGCRPSQHLEQRQRPKRRLKRGARVRNLGQIGYAKTRQLAAARQVGNERQHREVGHIAL